MEAKISVVIPNHNGCLILEKNLPNVINNSPEALEIIVVDDASTDDSVNFLKKNFKGIKVIEIKKNRGFANSANTGVRNAKGELVVLLNSDVSPRNNYLKYSLPYFKDAQTFAVGFEDQSHEDGKIIKRGRGGAKFTTGMFTHFKIPGSLKGETLWVSGGSGIFDKMKFLELGGFDLIYAPFYWEDIDLSYRAWKAGYCCYFEPNSKVDHYHEEGAINKSSKPNKVKTIVYRNQFLFIWKNINDDAYIISHLLYLPYYLTKAVLVGDFQLIFGFVRAIIKLPLLIFATDNNNYKLSDREIISKFNKYAS